MSSTGLIFQPLLKMIADFPVQRPNGLLVCSLYIGSMSKRRFAPGVLAVVLVVVFGAVGGSVGFIDAASGQDSVLVENDISSDTTWESGTGPYRIVKSVTVTQEATLTIEPGVTVELAEDVDLTVEGNLQAVGAADQPIVFTSSKSSPKPGSWGTLELAGSYGTLTRVHHAEITYGTDGITLADSQRVGLVDVEIAESARAGINGSDSSGYAPTGEITVEDSSIHHNQFGIRGYDERFAIVGSSITDNAAEGIKLTNSLNIVDIRIRDSVIARNDIGIVLESGPDQHNRGGVIQELTVLNTTVRANAGDGVRLFGDRIVDVEFSDSRIVANGGDGLRIQDTGNTGGSRPTESISVLDSAILDNGNIGLRVHASYSDVKGIEVRGNEIDGNGATGATIGADRMTSEIVLADNVALRNGGDGLAVSGTEIRDVRISGQRSFGNDGSGVAIVGENVSSIEVASSRASLNDHAGVLVNGTNDHVGTTVTDSIVAANDHGLLIADHPTTIEGSVIEYNNVTGVRFEGERSVGNVIAASDIYGNENGVWVPEGADEMVANVTNNYWGASSGPHHASVNPEGEGDSVNGGLTMVEFLPYAETPFGEVNERPEAVLEEPSDPVEPGAEVTISATQSTDDGEVRWYNFAFNNSTNTGWTREAAVTRSFEYPGTYVVNLTVADDHGVPSAENANVTITVEAAGEGSNDEGGNSSNGNGSGSGSDGGTGTGTNGDTEEGLDVQVPGFGLPVTLLSVILALFVVRRIGIK